MGAGLRPGSVQTGVGVKVGGDGLSLGERWGCPRLPARAEGGTEGSAWPRPPGWRKAGGRRGSEPRSGAKEMKILSKPVTGYLTFTSISLSIKWDDKGTYLTGWWCAFGVR